MVNIDPCCCMSGSLFFVLPCSIPFYKDIQLFILLLIYIWIVSAFDYCEESSYELFKNLLILKRGKGRQGERERRRQKHRFLVPLFYAFVG